MIEKIAIIGAGAMGSLFAARFARAGFQVTMVDIDRARMEFIDREGLILRDDSGEHKVSVGAKLADELPGPVDLLVIFTKGIHTRAAAASVAHLAKYDPAVLTLQNGVGNAELIGETFAPETITVGTAHVPADIEPPNVVCSGGFGHLAIGPFRPEGAPHARAIAETLRRAGWETDLSDNVDAVIWEKLAFNAALNALAMVTFSTNGDMDNPFARDIAGRLVEETVLVAEACGIALDAEGILATVNLALSEHASHKASMLQDRESGRATEIDFINGAVIREGVRLGIPTPTHLTLVNLVKLAELKDGITSLPA